MRIYFSGMKREEWVAPMPLEERGECGLVNEFEECLRRV